MPDQEFKTSFGVVEFTTKELLQLPEADRDLLLSACLITNDIRFHWSLLGRAKIDSNERDLKTMQAVRDLWTLRKLAAVISEAEQTLATFTGKIGYIRDAVNRGLRIIPDKSKYRDMLKVATLLRNRTAYHYGTKELGGQIEGFAPETIHSIYAHKQHGNSISALCEQILTLPAIRNAGDGIAENDFQAWCLDCSNSILHFCNIAISLIVKNHFPQAKFEMREVELGIEAQPFQHRWPLFTIVDHI